MQTLRVEVRCVACKELGAVYVDPLDYADFVLGKHAQNAFPYLTADERELLITSMCLDCIEEMYADMEEEEDDYDWEERELWVEDPDNDPLAFPVNYESDYYVDEDCD